MSVLITGGNGMVGAALVALLLSKGEEVAVFDINFDTTLLSRKQKERVTFIQGDLSIYEEIFEAVEKTAPKVIYHLASMLSVPCEADPHTALQVNGFGSYNILEAARIFNVKQIIYSSSLSVYANNIPDNKYIDQSTVERPSTIYATTKLFVEQLGYYYKVKYGLDFRAVRFSSLVGPGGKVRHISAYNAWMIEKSYLGEPFEIYVNPNNYVTLTYYKDAAECLFQLAEAPLDSIKTVCYNLPGQPSRAYELKAMVEEIIPTAQLSYNPDPEVVSIWDKKGYVEYDDSAVREEWKWNPKYSTRDMIIDFGTVLEEMKNNLQEK